MIWNLTRPISAKVDWFAGVWFPFNTPRYSEQAMHMGQNLTLEHGCVNHVLTLFRATCNPRPPLLQMSILGRSLEKPHSEVTVFTYTNKWEDVIRLLTDHTKDTTQLFLLRYVFQATLSTIWKERNGRKHGEDSHPPAILIKGIDKIVRNKLIRKRHENMVFISII